MSNLTISKPVCELLIKWNLDDGYNGQTIDEVLSQVSTELVKGSVSKACCDIDQMQGAFLTLFIEGARTSKDPKSLVDDCRHEVGITNESVLDKIAATYGKLEKRLNYYLLQTSSTFLPHIVDCSADLKYEILTTESGRSAQFFYLLRLDIQMGSGVVNSIEMVCTVEELQDLVAILKDAKKNLEKLANAQT